MLYLKEELRELWNQTSRKQMQAFLKDWCDVCRTPACVMLT